jgi:hypothetical protein
MEMQIIMNHHVHSRVFGVLFSTRNSGRSGVVLAVIKGGIELMFAEHRAWCGRGNLGKCKWDSSHLCL